MYVRIIRYGKYSSMHSLMCRDVLFEHIHNIRAQTHTIHMLKHTQYTCSNTHNTHAQTHTIHMLSLTQNRHDHTHAQDTWKTYILHMFTHIRNTHTHTHIIHMITHIYNTHTHNTHTRSHEKQYMYTVIWYVYAQTHASDYQLASSRPISIPIHIHGAKYGAVPVTPLPNSYFHKYTYAYHIHVHIHAYTQSMQAQHTAYQRQSEHTESETHMCTQVAVALESCRHARPILPPTARVYSYLARVLCSSSRRLATPCYGWLRRAPRYGEPSDCCSKRSSALRVRRLHVSACPALLRVDPVTSLRLFWCTAFGFRRFEEMLLFGFGLSLCVCMCVYVLGMYMRAHVIHYERRGPVEVTCVCIYA